MSSQHLCGVASAIHHAPPPPDPDFDARWDVLRQYKVRGSRDTSFTRASGGCWRRVAITCCVQVTAPQPMWPVVVPCRHSFRSVETSSGWRGNRSTDHIKDRRARNGITLASKSRRCCPVGSWQDSVAVVVFFLAMPVYLPSRLPRPRYKRSSCLRALSRELLIPGGMLG